MIRFPEWCLAAILALFLPGISGAQAQDDLSNHFSVCMEFGNWQPHSLNDEPRFSTFGAAGATAFLGISFLAPLGGDTGIRLGAGYWALRDLDEVESVHSLVLHPVTMDIKYWLVPDYRLSAYVIYGGGVYWGIENEKNPLGGRLRKARAGWGANLGAGFDLKISRRYGIGMDFEYHYVRFGEPLGGGDDFSGPKITAMMYYFF